MTLTQEQALQSEDYFYDGDTYCLQRFDLDSDFGLYVLDVEEDEWEEIEDVSDDYWQAAIAGIKQENNWIA